MHCVERRGVWEGIVFLREAPATCCAGVGWYGPHSTLCQSNGAAALPRLRVAASAGTTCLGKAPHHRCGSSTRRRDVGGSGNHVWLSSSAPPPSRSRCSGVIAPCSCVKRLDRAAAELGGEPLTGVRRDGERAGRDDGGAQGTQGAQRRADEGHGTCWCVATKLITQSRFSQAAWTL